MRVQCINIIKRKGYCVIIAKTTGKAWLFAYHGESLNMYTILDLHFFTFTLKATVVKLLPVLNNQ